MTTFTPTDPSPDLLRFDYEQTVSQFAMLVDIRFKLLALLPTVTGAAIGLLDGGSPGQSLAVGLLGLVTTTGIGMYEIRNSQLHDALVHRAKGLEELLNLPVLSKGNMVGGIFSERPGRDLALFDRVKAYHKTALAWVYGAVLAGWTYLVVQGLLALAGQASGPPGDPLATGLSIAAALAAGVVFGKEVYRLSKQGRPGKPDAAGSQLP